MTPFDPYAYLDAVAAALDLPVTAGQREGVAANLARLELLARQIMPGAERDDTAGPERAR